MSKQIRNTPAKTEIIRILEQSKIALSHIELQEKLNGLCDRVTIYRVLERLLNEKIIHKTTTTNGGVKYAICTQTCTDKNHLHNHLHFTCENCKKTFCLEEVIPKFNLPEDYFLKDLHFTASGLCKNCKNI